MVAQEDHMTLAKLSPDIMRNIIQIEHESIDELRLISKSWNDVINDLFHNRSNRLFLEGVTLDKFTQDGIVHAVWYVPRKDSSELANAAHDWELSHQNKQKHPVYFRDLPWDIPSQPARRPHFRNDIILGNRIQFADKFKPTNTENSGDEEVTENVQHSLESLRRLFLRISEIDSCMLIDMTATDLMLIAKTMRHLPMNELCITMRICDEEIRAAILEILKYAKIKRLSLLVHYFTRRNLSAFLLNISKKVQKLEISQGNDKIPFYGIPREFWATTSRQMLNNGLQEFLFSRETSMMRRFRHKDSQAETNDEARLNVSF